MKFILIDHSITDLGGHHYQYAVAQLRAAQEAGYHPILAVNRGFKSSGPLGWDVHPVYTYGFFLRLSEPPWHRWFNMVKRAIRGRLFWLSANLAFSVTGFLWVIRNELRTYLRRQAPSPQSIVRTLLILAFLYLWSVVSAFRRLLRALLPFSQYIRRVVAECSRFFLSLVSPATMLFEPQPWLQHWLADLLRGRAFGWETLRLMRRMRLEEGDLVFLPTVSEVEMLGLLRYFARDAASVKASWHLLFRRDIFRGREPDYPAQDDDQRARRNAFAAFQRAAHMHAIHFYTDTDALTAQYRRLGLPFRTLPIPHTHPPQPRGRGEIRPLNLVYLGDARSEKGYHYLPRLIGDLWDEFVASERAIFTLQSNFNIPQGEPEAVVARAQLEAFPRDRVRLIYTQLSPENYERLLISADVVLLPYDRENYYARSSGILVEALAAGIPVVVPAGTWLSQQFIGQVYAYHRSLPGRLPMFKRRRSAELRWRRHGQPEKSASVDGIITFGGKKRAAYCWLAVPRDAAYLLVDFHFESYQPGSFMEIYVDQLDSNSLSRAKEMAILGATPESPRASALFPIVQGVCRIWLGCSNAWADEIVHLNEVQVDFMGTPDMHRAIPLSAVGVAYASPDRLTAAVQDVLRHYAHYAQTAEAFADSVVRKHNAHRLVEILQNRAKPRVEWASAGSP